MAIVEIKKVEKKEEKASPRKARAASKPSSELKGFAVIETGGKQYKVSSGDVLMIEKMSDIHKQGDAIVFDKVLLLSDGEKVTMGDPYIKDATVNAVFEDAVRGKKINVLKFKSKSRWTRRWGHRQPYAKIRVL
ncbi:MAG: 50S ribosomal protein L21 [bacterium]|nr:50S ribosomal protein L21 [bacterium]